MEWQNTTILSEATAECGKTILFWSDLWNGRILQLTYPHLHSFTKIGNISVKEFVQTEERHTLFNLPLSEEALGQFCNLDITLQTIQLMQTRVDGIMYEAMRIIHQQKHISNS
jgi:hypothetical protein